MKELHYSPSARSDLNTSSVIQKTGYGSPKQDEMVEYCILHPTTGEFSLNTQGGATVSSSSFRTEAQVHQEGGGDIWVRGGKKTEVQRSKKRSFLEEVDQLFLEEWRKNNPPQQKKGKFSHSSPSHTKATNRMEPPINEPPNMTSIPSVSSTSSSVLGIPTSERTLSEKIEEVPIEYYLKTSLNELGDVENMIDEFAEQCTPPRLDTPFLAVDETTHVSHTLTNPVPSHPFPPLNEKFSLEKFLKIGAQHFLDWKKENFSDTQEEDLTAQEAFLSTSAYSFIYPGNFVEPHEFRKAVEELRKAQKSAP